MGMTNVLIQHKPAVEALTKAARIVRLKPEQVAVRYLAELLLQNRYEEDMEGDVAQKTIVTESAAVLVAIHKLLPITGGQFVETFDVDFEYGVDFLGPGLNTNVMWWEHEIVSVVADKFDLSMNAALMATMVYLGNQILAEAKA